jgi:hypothetical protein
VRESLELVDGEEVQAARALYSWRAATSMRLAMADRSLGVS